MEKKETFGSVKRLGVRYGRTTRFRLGQIEHMTKLSDQCPYCHYHKSRKLSAGIWFCEKCGSKFTGRAFDLRAGKPSIMAEVKPQEEQKEAEE